MQPTHPGASFDRFIAHVIGPHVAADENGTGANEK